MNGRTREPSPAQAAALALTCIRDNVGEHAEVASTERWTFNDVPHAPRVSVLVPTYRRPGLLVQAVRSALAQERFDDYEILIVDNDPDSDGSVLEALEPFIGTRRIRYCVNAANLGMTGNWNRCAQLARGAWITFLHDDDWLAPRFLADASEWLDSGVGVVASAVRSGHHDYEPQTLSSREKPQARRLDLSSYILGNITPAPGLLLRRELLMRLGGFDDTYYPCSDYVAYVRAALQGGAVRLSKPLAYYRTTDSATFKGDTLIRMIRFSRAFKLELLARAPSALNRAAYLQSMAFWFHVGRSNGLDLEAEMNTPLDRMAGRLSRSRAARKLLGAVRLALSVAARFFGREQAVVGGS